MSLFRSRKKSFNDGDSARRPSLEEAPPMPSGGLGKYSFRRKKNQPEVKKSIDIATALPSKDDFRTSLLMPNLSARFSMLREQDDPNTKVGKASDDSVLFPKRASRLNLFSAADLADIAEVSSLSGSIRPPFANERSSTYSSGDGGYATDDDRSVMTRSRPGQGNKFFGGRQKIYMLSTKDGESGSGRPKGRAVYDDDINLAAFKELQRPSEDNDRDFDADYNSKRETSSSTNSGPFDSRVSTAATSVSSTTPSPATQSTGFANKLNSFSTTGGDRPAKGKRLYGQGLDQQIHDQQYTALNRLNSIQRNFGPGMVHYGSVPVSRNVPNLNNGLVKPVLDQPSGFVPLDITPAKPLANLEQDITQDVAKDNVVSRPFGVLNAPMSPPMSPTDPTLVAALDANDHGKATATGAFNKPAGPYNDEQFAQRQLQLQQGRETPPPRAFSRSGTTTTSNSNNSRERNGSLASQRSGFSFQSSQARTQPSIREQTSTSQLRTCETPENGDHNSNGAYLASVSGSEYGSEPSSPNGITTKNLAHTAFNGGIVDPALRHRKYKHDDQHPAFSSRVDLNEEHSDVDGLTDLPIQSHSTSAAQSINISREAPEDSETQGGLSDLVRGHLRNISNDSSVYPDSPPRSSHGDIPEFPAELARQHGFPPSAGLPANPLAARARAMLENANQLRNAASTQNGGQYAENNKFQQQFDSPTQQRNADSPEIPWQEQLKSHQRQGSTETQREREDFASELADRRKQVQSNLRNYVSDSQSNNNRSNDHSPPRAGALGLLKKASFSNLAGRGESNSKASRILGMQDSGNYPSSHEPRSMFQSSKSSEQLNRMERGTSPAQAYRERNFSPEPRQNYMRKASDSPARGMERSPPSKTPSPNPNGYGFVRASPDTYQGAYHPAGRARKYSPPSASRRAEPGQAPYMRSVSAQGQHPPPPFRAGTMDNPYFPPADSRVQGSVFNDSPRGSPISPAFSGASPPEPPFANGTISRNGSNPSLPLQTGRKGSINKSEISIPTFVSGTSSMITVDLPQGASLHNGIGANGAHAPPLPPINPRRRGQNFFSPFGNRSAINVTSSSTPSSEVTTPTDHVPYMTEEPEELRSPKSDEMVESKPRFRTRLRKSSSAGENMSQRARHQALKELDKIPRSPDLATSNRAMF